MQIKPKADKDLMIQDYYKVLRFLHTHFSTSSQGWGAGAGAGAGARSHGASQFCRSRSWSRSLFKYFCGARAGAGATKILLAPAPVMVHRINFIE